MYEHDDFSLRELPVPARAPFVLTFVFGGLSVLAGILSVEFLKSNGGTPVWLIAVLVVSLAAAGLSLRTYLKRFDEAYYEIGYQDGVEAALRQLEKKITYEHLEVTIGGGLHRNKAYCDGCSTGFWKTVAEHSAKK